jgi:hypothetical protein
VERRARVVVSGIRSIGELLVAAHIQLLSTIGGPEIDCSLTIVVSEAENLEKRLGLGDQF